MARLSLLYAAAFAAASLAGSALAQDYRERLPQDEVIYFLLPDRFENGDPAHQTPQNFAKLTRSDYAYTPYIPRGQEHIKVPDWLNDPIYYHNRGNTTFEGESAEAGDFAGLDDLMTENPRVVQGFIDIYGAWIDRYRVAGFRIDTAKHVNPEFWQGFVPAMLARARDQGIVNFHIFGEVSTGAVDVALLARHTRLHGLPAVLDFAFAAAVRDTVAGSHGTDVLARLFADDVRDRPLAAAAANAAGAHFDRRHPLYRAFAELASLRQAQPALRRGRQIVRSYGPDAGLFAVSRIDPGTGRELLIVFNTSTAPLLAQVQVNAGSRHFSSLHGQCEWDVTATGSYRVAVGPLDYVLCTSADAE